MYLRPRRPRKFARKALVARKVTPRKVTALKFHHAEVPAAGRASVDPLPILNELHPYPISLMAGFADNGFILSGSKSVGGASADDSDFDMYGIADPDAVIEMLDLLSFADVRWDNLLLRRLEDVVDHGSTIMPYEEIYHLANYIPGHWKVHRIQHYVKNLLETSDSYREYADEFSSQFYLALQECYTNLQDDSRQKEEWRGSIFQRIWIFKPGQAKQPNVRQLPPIIAETINAMLDTLDGCPYPRSNDILDGSFEQEVKSCLADKFELDELNTPTSVEDKIDFGKVRHTWKEEGYPEHLMKNYIWYKMIQEVPHRRYEIAFLVGCLFQTPWEIRPKTEPIAGDYDPMFRILRGTLPNGKKLQLMLVPTTLPGGILRTVLRFHATHPMSCISGTLGCHLYYHTAKEKISHTLDFTRDTRHRHALKGIEKQEKRGWKFDHMSREDVMTRRATDSKVLMTEYEEIYKSALRSLGHDDHTLPDWWNDYFKERKNAFETYGWVENYGRITHISNVRFRLSEEAKLLEWAHRELQGHTGVIPKEQWERRDDMQAKLDLWFSGARMEGTSCDTNCLL
jgi:hypothetical protein